MLMAIQLPKNNFPVQSKCLCDLLLLPFILILIITEMLYSCLCLFLHFKYDFKFGAFSLVISITDLSFP